MNSIRVIVPFSENAAWVLDEFDVDLKHEPFLLGVPDMLMDLDADSPAAQIPVTLFFIDSVLEPGATRKPLHS